MNRFKSQVSAYALSYLPILPPLIHLYTRFSHYQLHDVGFPIFSTVETYLLVKEIDLRNRIRGTCRIPSDLNLSNPLSMLPYLHGFGIQESLYNISYVNFAAQIASLCNNTLSFDRTTLAVFFSIILFQTTAA